MMDTAEIWLWGSRIGIIHQGEGDMVPSFEYDAAFRDSGIQPAPFKMPLSRNVFRFPELRDSEAFRGLPGLLADSLPDRFGNSVIDVWLEARGRPKNSMTAIERLCYTGKRGMGALEYVPATYEGRDIDSIDVTELTKLASAILSGKERYGYDADDVSTAQLIDIGSSAGGSRAKAVIAWNESTGDVRSGQTPLSADYGQWLIKFDNIEGSGDHGVRDRKQYTLIEYAYYLMARDLGIDMTECRILEKDGMSHFMTRRFDRKDGKKVFVQTLAALRHIDFNEPGLCSYESFAECSRQLGMGMDAAKEIFRRMAFNAISMNCDDHVKNFSFIMGRDGKWSLSPAYDMTFAYNPMNRWLKGHQMTINGKAAGITDEDLISCGGSMGLGKSFCRSVLKDTKDVVANWKEYADRVGIDKGTIESIRSCLRV